MLQENLIYYLKKLHFTKHAEKVYKEFYDYTYLFKYNILRNIQLPFVTQKTFSH